MSRVSRFPICVAVCALLLLTPALGSAEPPGNDYSRSGFYVGVNGVGGTSFLGVVEDTGINVGSTGGIDARVGYRILPWLAFEANYEWMNNFALDFGGSNVGGLTTHGITGGPKFILPTWRAQPYLLLGIGAQYADLGLTGFGSRSQWDVFGRPAVGVDFYATENWVVNVEVAGGLSDGVIEGLGSSFSNVFYISYGAGVQYRF